MSLNGDGVAAFDAASGFAFSDFNVRDVESGSHAGQRFRNFVLMGLNCTDCGFR